MKKTLQILAVFCQNYLQFGSMLLFGIIHRAQSATLLWLACCIGVVEQCCQMVYYNTIVCKNGIILHVCVHGRRKDFFQEAATGLFQKFLQGGAISGEIWFLPLETKKIAFFVKFSHSCPQGRIK